MTDRLRLPIQGPRVTLRAPTSADGASPAATARHPESDWLPIVIDRTGVRAGHLAVRLDETGSLAELTMGLRPDALDPALATEAVGTLVDTLFERGSRRVAATLDADDTAVAMLLERVGFRYEGHSVGTRLVEGEWRDEVHYAILASERHAWIARPRTPPATVRLVALDPGNVSAVGALATHHSQERFVQPMGATFGDALAGETVNGVPVVPWYRVIEADGQPVGFLMIAEATPPDGVPFLGRLLIDRMHQGRGIGTRAIELLAARLRDLGRDRLHTGWYRGDGSPEPFYLRLGFVPDGRVIDDQVIAELSLGRPGAR